MVRRRGDFHIGHGKYNIENSFYGILLMIRSGFLWIDIDIHRIWRNKLMTAKVTVCGHWPKLFKDNFRNLPGWFVRRYGSRPSMSKVFYDDLKQLHSAPTRFRGRKYRTRYRTAEEMIVFLSKHSKRKGITFEAKGADEDFRSHDYWDDLMNFAESQGMGHRVRMKVLRSNPHHEEIIAAAKSAGWRTRVINK